MRVRHHILGVEDAPRGNARLDHLRFQLLDRQRCRPFADQRVEFFLSNPARAVRRITRVARQLGPAHRRGEACKDTILIGADQIFAIAARDKTFDGAMPGNVDPVRRRLVPLAE